VQATSASGDSRWSNVASATTERGPPPAPAVLVARAAALSGVPYLEVRGISDMADHDFLGEFEAIVPVAMANVASVVAWLAEHPVPAQEGATGA
jgi:nucleoside phosphorylase